MRNTHQERLVRLFAVLGVVAAFGGMPGRALIHI
jgi:hypothetical protein